MGEFDFINMKKTGKDSAFPSFLGISGLRFQIGIVANTAENQRTAQKL